MSWSTCANGQFGLVREDTLRLAVLLDVQGERDEMKPELGGPLSEVYDAGFRHFLFRIKRQRKAKGFFYTRNLINALLLLREKSKMRNPLQDCALFITVCTDNVDSGFIKELFTTVCGNEDAVDVDCLVLDFNSFLANSPLSSFSTTTFESSIKKVAELSTLIMEIKDVVLACKRDGLIATGAASVMPPSIQLGIDGIFDRGILQLLFEQPAGRELRVVVPGSVHLPNFRSRVIDFVHSRAGPNILHVLSNDTILNTPSSEEFGPVLYPLIRKYPQSKMHVAPVLVKCLLQLGVIVSFNISTGVPFILEMIAPLLHPFVNRKEFVAPSITMRFVIALEEVEAFVEDSEKEEQKEEDWWRKTTLHRSKARTLTDVIPLDSA